MNDKHMKSSRLPTVFRIILVLAVSSITANAQYLFNNPEVDIEIRIDDLINRLTIEEKAALMVHNTKGVDRLNIPPYDWWNECLHGIARAGRATIFPQAIGLAATFDPSLINAVATTISTEGRAKYNEAIKIGARGRYQGLTYWSPNVNLFRDPRWGRGQETYGEDPFLSGQIGIAFVQGIQGNHPKYLKAAACAKHFVVHSGPEMLRHEFDALTTESDLYNTYLPAFKALVDSDVAGVMCAYNRTNGEVCCGSPTLLTGILRQDWNFDGYIVSDCWALSDFWSFHKVLDNATESAALAINNSVNMNCGTVYSQIPEAVNQGLITESDVDAALAGSLRILFRLGWFDPHEDNPWSDLDNKDIASADNIALARKVAAKSVVLLKNNGILPLKKDIKSVYVTGPNATSLEALWANYHGFSDQMTTGLEGIISKVSAGTIVSYNEGCKLTDDMDFKGLSMSANHDITLAYIGLNPLLEGEEGDAYLSKYGGDKNDLQLPANQIEFIKELKKGGKPIIAVVMGGSAISLGSIKPYVDAILWTGYPGEQGGNGIADILFGDENPGGRLPITFYKSVDDLPPFEDYSMNNRTYRYFNGAVEYPFGYGLSYTSFKYLDAKQKQVEYSKTGSIQLTVLIENTGSVAGDEVLQVYYNKPGATNRPIKSLIAFARIFLEKGERKDVLMTIPLERLQWYSPKKSSYEIEQGSYQLLIGGSSEDIHKTLNLSIK
jgi:beta-glucosidase